MDPGETNVRTIDKKKGIKLYKSNVISDHIGYVSVMTKFG